MDLEIISAIIFYAILAVVLFFNRKKLSLMSKIIIAVKSKKGISFMEKLGKHKTFFKILSTIAIPIAFYFMFVVMSQILFNLYYTVTIPNPEPTVAFVIPGVRIPGSPLFFPFWYTIIAIIIVAAIHEFSHGVVAISEKVPIKTAGFGLFFIFFIAFVEPDEKKMLKASNLTRIRIAAAGPVSNIVLAFVIFSLLTYMDPLLAQNYEFQGVELVELLEGYPAEQFGLEQGMIITSVNQTMTTNLSSFTQVLVDIAPNSTVPIITDQGEFNVTLTSRPENESLGYLGVIGEQSWTFKENNILSQTGLVLFGVPHFRTDPYERGLLWWVAMIGFFIGIMNLLPIFGLDGGIILYSLFSYIVKNESRRNRIAMWVFTFFTGALILTIFLPYIL